METITTGFFLQIKKFVIKLIYFELRLFV